MVNNDGWRLLQIWVLVIGLSVLQTETIDWLSLSGLRDLPAWNRTSDCRRDDLGLAKGQRRMCMRNLELMPSIVHAARTSADVCQRLFYDSRWNCSSIRLAPKFLSDLKTGNREQAFVYALTSASLAHALSKACSSGVTGKCQCGPLPNEPPSGEFQWGGCGDDISYGIAFSQSFVEWQWVQRGTRKRNAKGMMTNLHNQRVGRKVVSESMQTVCKCHGVSGSCTTRTCWKSLQDMRTIGFRLYHSYTSAVEVRMRRNSRADRILVPVMHQARKNFTADELVYHSLSPDYCAPDPELGSVGTRGRECSKNSTGSIGCVSMCCGRGHTSEWVRVDYRCECKYIWCCYVKCQTCTKTVEVHRCR